jgi:ketosteroid isomerase-like protein
LCGRADARTYALRLCSEAGSFDVVAVNDRVVRLRGIYEAINRGDLKVLADWFPRGFEWHPDAGEPEQEVRRSLEGALERITGFTSSFDTYRIEVEEVVVGDERIAVRVRHVGSIGGRELSEREAHVWVFAGDRPVALHEFRDWDRARSEAGVDGV